MKEALSVACLYVSMILQSNVPLNKFWIRNTKETSRYLDKAWGKLWGKRDPK